MAEIGRWQAEAARCDRLRAGTYNPALWVELDRLAREYRAHARLRRAD
jgi:hypothetical protein